MSKNNVYATFSPATGGNFLKFENNKPVKIKIMSDCYIWLDRFNESVNRKFGWVIWNFDQNEAQILNLPVTGYKAIATIGADDDFGDLTDLTLKIVRTGSGFDTTYSVNVLPNAKDELTNDQVAAGLMVNIMEAKPNAVRLEDFATGKVKLVEPEVKPQADDDGYLDAVASGQV